MSTFKVECLCSGHFGDINKVGCLHLREIIICGFCESLIVTFPHFKGIRSNGFHCIS